MTPRIEVDSHQDDWYPSPQPFTTSNDEPSPLFRDHDSTISPPSISRLDRRQSDPDFSAIVLKEDPIKLAVAPVVSRITAIIGPESAYVRTSTPSPSSGSPPPLSTIRPASKPTSQQQPQMATTKKSPSQKGKIETKPILLRAMRFVSKKGWKVVKSLFQINWRQVWEM